MMKRRNKKQPEPVVLPKPEVVWEGEPDEYVGTNIYQRVRCVKTWKEKDGKAVSRHRWEWSKENDATGAPVWKGATFDPVPESFYEAAFKKREIHNYPWGSVQFVYSIQ